MEFFCDLARRMVSYEVWRGDHLLLVVYGPEGMAVRQVKEQAKKDMWVSNNVNDLNHLPFAEVYVRRDSKGKKAKLS